MNNPIKKEMIKIQYLDEDYGGTFKIGDRAEVVGTEKNYVWVRNRYGGTEYFYNYEIAFL